MPTQANLPCPPKAPPQRRERAGPQAGIFSLLHSPRASRSLNPIQGPYPTSPATASKTNPAPTVMPAQAGIHDKSQPQASLFRFPILICLLATWFPTPAAAQSATWTTLATTSGTLVPGSLCTTDGKDLTCNQSLSGLQSPDRITSSTAGIFVSDTGTINLRTGGTTTGYFDTSGLLVIPGISITTANGISSTNGFFSGKVGFNILTPNTTIQVSGDISTRANGSSQVWAGHGGNYIRMREGYPATLESYLGMQFKVSGSQSIGPLVTAVTISLSGDVGIGITKPNAKLDVSGTVSSTDIQLSRTGTAPASKCATTADEGRMVMTANGPFVCLIR